MMDYLIRAFQNKACEISTVRSFHVGIGFGSFFINIAPFISSIDGYVKMLT